MMEDDTILLIVGDEVHVEDSRNDQMPHVCIKVEHLDESESEPPVETASKDFEYVDIKEENDTETLVEKIPNHYFPEIEYRKKKIDKHKNSFDPEEKGYIPEGYEDADAGGQVSKQRVKVSFVNQLREANPEMKENPILLVDELAKIMKDLKPPDPPENSYIMRRDKDEKIKFECCVCQAMSGSFISATRHYQDKHGKRYLMCYACGADYRSTTNLYKHEKRCTAADAKLVLAARGRHLGRKGRARPFTTDHKFENKCPPAAPAKPRRLFCSKCPASYARRQNLIAHENTHDGVRPYRCDACPAAYTSEEALKRHLHSHGENKFICDHCGRQFKFKPALASHMDTHRPIPKYGCPHCERRFAQKNALTHHVNLKHLQLPPACGCPVCPKRYARMTHVKEHMKKAHGVTMVTRRMFYTALPHLTDEKVIQKSRVVLNSEMKQITSLPTPLPPKKNVQNTKNATKKNLENSTPETKQPRKVNRSIQDNKEQEVYEIVLDEEENAETMNKFVRHIRSKASGDKIEDVNKKEPAVMTLLDNPVKVIKIPSLTLS